jgi:hypothetical protein
MVLTLSAWLWNAFRASVYIDWVGDQPEILLDTTSGERKNVHFFVTTVGVSNLIYTEAFEDEKLPNFIVGLSMLWGTMVQHQSI